MQYLPHLSLRLKGNRGDMPPVLTSGTLFGDFLSSKRGYGNYLNNGEDVVDIAPVI